MDTIEAARGRWREILPALGVPSVVLNGKNQPCPMCGGKDRFRFTDKFGEGDYYCSQCSPGRGLKLLMNINGWDFKQAVQEIDKVIGNLLPAKRVVEFATSRAANPGSLRRMYADSRPVLCEDAVGRYLFRRQLHEPYPKALRYVPLMKHWPTGTTHRGMIAMYSNAEGKPVTLHRTYLTDEGLKADLDGKERLFMSGDVPVGGAVRLTPAAETMGIAEGIETALSAAVLFGVPVWASCCDQLLAKWQPPPEAKRIVIYGDADMSFAGQAAAYTLAKRLKNVERLEVGVALPPIGKDWNDVLMEAADGE